MTTLSRTNSLDVNKVAKSSYGSGDFKVYGLIENPPNDDIDSFFSQFSLDPRVQEGARETRKMLGETVFGDSVSLKSLRLRAGLSQSKLADLMGMKQPQLAKLETGKVEPKLGTLVRLSGALSVTLDELALAFPQFTGEDQ